MITPKSRIRNEQVGEVRYSTISLIVLISTHEVSYDNDDDDNDE